MKKCLLFSVLIFTLSAFGQQYKTSIGIKGGYPGFGSLNIKHFFGGSSAIEGSLGGGARHIWLQGLYERNKALDQGVEWYYGIGADIGFWTNGYAYYNAGKNQSYTGAWGGLDGVLGLEYTFEDIPLNLAIDLGPSICLFPYVGLTWNGGLAIRYAFR